MLQAFFDETGGDEKSNLTAVVGFLFDSDGRMQFDYEWHQQVRGLSKPYRTSDCNAGVEPFCPPPQWPQCRRQKLMDDLAVLCADYSLAGFVVATRMIDFEDAVENGHWVRKHVDSPYTLCMLGVLSSMSEWMSKNVPGENVDCVFEEGAYHEKEARAAFGRLSANSDTKADFSNINRCSWNPKSSFLTLARGGNFLWSK